MDNLLNWIYKLNKELYVNIEHSSITDKTFWFYDKEKGCIRNKDNTFFSIYGIKGNVNGEPIEQPIIIQNEIGFLGIICKDFKGVTKYLMQAKIEPGNINCIQISPTIQATKSNFTQVHGGNKPLYLDYFLSAKDHDIIVDQIQSEQSSRFYKKRNRNIIIKIDDDVMIENERFKWMTLLEIKKLMRYRNLVNMDTRTVLSCLPLVSPRIEEIDPIYSQCNILFKKSYQDSDYVNEIANIYNKINNYKMFNNNDAQIVKLSELKNWTLSDSGIKCKQKYPYEIIYCNIEIEGREVTHWLQPLFKSNGIATFGLIRTIVDDKYKYLVKLSPEIGSFDQLEIGPTIQKEYGALFSNDPLEQLFKNKIDHNEDIVFDSIMSEEGGRFYHEENRNIILDVVYDELLNLPDNYELVSYATLSHLNLVNNCLNIQLRNLMSILEV